MNRLDIAYLFASVLAIPVLLMKRRRGWRQRLGHVEPMLKHGASVGPLEHRKPRVMLHAVSVGEVNALRSLVPLLTPRCEVIVSTTTDTGLTRARSVFGDTCEVVRYPLDFSWAVNRFLETIRPDVVALVELELWPNFIRACGSRSIPVAVVNGRLSARSFRGYRRFRWFFRGAFQSLRFAAVQDTDYRDRFVAMGVPQGLVHVTGSMKWDNARSGSADETLKKEAEALAANLGIDLGRPIVVAGSTGPGEESLIHRACAQAGAGLGLQLVCAPRKPERFDEAADAIRGCVRRSETRDNGPPSTSSDRFLLDTIGELAAAYALADVAIVGRSFGDLHGSDPTEPIGLGCPTIIGPAVGDFQSIVDAFEEQGGIIRATRENLAATIRALVDDRDRAHAVAAAGVLCIEGKRGASALHAEKIFELFDG